MVPKGFSLPQRIVLRDGDRIALAHRLGPSLLFLDVPQGREDDELDQDGSFDEDEPL